MLNFILILTILAAFLHLLTEAKHEIDDQVNQLFCQLNEYAILRINNQEDVFPCREEE